LNAGDEWASGLSRSGTGLPRPVPVWRPVLLGPIFSAQKDIPDGQALSERLMKLGQ